MKSLAILFETALLLVLLMANTYFVSAFFVASSTSSIHHHTYYYNTSPLQMSSSPAASDGTQSTDELIQEAKKILYAAAETKSEDSDKVVGALLDLEKLMRQKVRAGVTKIFTKICISMCI